MSATAKPCISCAQMSTSTLGEQDQLEQARGQREAQAVVEDREHDDGEHEADAMLSSQRRLPKPRATSTKSTRRGEDEADALDQQAVAR